MKSRITALILAFSLAVSSFSVTGVQASDKIDELIEMLQDAGTAIADTASDAADSAADRLNETGAAIAGTISDAAGSARDRLDAAGAAISDTISDAAGSARDKLDAAGAAIAGTVSDAADSARDKLDAVGSVIQDTAYGALEKASETGSSVSGHVLSSILDLIGPQKLVSDPMILPSVEMLSTAESIPRIMDRDPVDQITSRVPGSAAVSDAVRDIMEETRRARMDAVSGLQDTPGEVTDSLLRGLFFDTLRAIKEKNLDAAFVLDHLPTALKVIEHKIRQGQIPLFTDTATALSLIHMAEYLCDRLCSAIDPNLPITYLFGKPGSTNGMAEIAINTLLTFKNRILPLISGLTSGKMSLEEFWKESAIFFLTAAAESIGGPLAGIAAEQTSGRIFGLSRIGDAKKMIPIIQEKYQQLSDEYLLDQKESQDITFTVNMSLTDDLIHEMYRSPDREAFAEGFLRSIIEDRLIYRTE